MFGLNRTQLKNGLMLGLIFFIFGQLWHELKEEPDHWETRQDLDVVQRDTETLQQRNKGMKAGGGKRQKLSKKQDPKWIENLEHERDTLLWEANLKNIMSGQDVLSPLIQPLPRVFQQDDPQLIEIIRQKYLIPPPDSKQHQYNIRAKNDTSMGQAQTVRKILNNKRNGFFIECGALDGETRSNSLFLEMENDWSGILIEADPTSLAKIRTKNRRAWLVPACLSTKRETMTVTFAAFGHVGHIANDAEAKNPTNEKFVNVTCLPLYSILMALNNPPVDYFSLDVEGYELSVLKTIPFDKVLIKTVSAEFFHGKERGSSNDEMKQHMISQGFRFHSTVTAPLNHANDFIFVHNSVH